MTNENSTINIDTFNISASAISVFLNTAETEKSGETHQDPDQSREVANNTGITQPSGIRSDS